MQRNDVRDFHQLVETHILRPVDLRLLAVVVVHLTAERLRERDRAPADGACADDAELLARKLDAEEAGARLARTHRLI